MGHTFIRKPDGSRQKVSQAEFLTMQCRHFNGVIHKKCEAGVRFNTFKQGIPCFTFDESPEICEKRSLWTKEEAEQQEKEAETSLENTLKAWKACLAFALAKLPSEEDNIELTWGTSGSFPCPICGSGTLHYRIAASNGHVHGKCTTPNCVHWMQ